jgi:hypothetical protein
MPSRATCGEWGNQVLASRFKVAWKLRLLAPIVLVPNASVLSPAKVPENPLVTSWPPASVRMKGSDSDVPWAPTAGRKKPKRGFLARRNKSEKSHSPLNLPVSDRRQSVLNLASESDQ